MARLPVVGGDRDNWGQVLNDYLSVEHNADGTLKLRTDGSLSDGIADGSVTAAKLSPTVNNYLASAQTAVQSVNGESGQAITLTASDVSAIATSAAGAASGVATLDGSSKLTASQLPATALAGNTNNAALDQTRQLPRYTLVANEDGDYEFTDPGYVPVSLFGALADCTQTGTAITVSSGSTTGTVGTLPTALRVGHTVVIDGVGNLVVAAINGTIITFTGAAPSSGSSRKFIFGTDNTTALNTAVAWALSHNCGLSFEAGTYLQTDTWGHTANDSNSYQGLKLKCAGAGINTARLANLGHNLGTTFVWGGAAGGEMVRFNRISHGHFQGGVAFVGQPSYDPSGVFTAFANRAGVGFILGQPGTPYTGAGYWKFDDVVFGDMERGFQFGDSVSDNNCDTSRFEKVVFWRCTEAGRIKHSQGLAYTFGFVHNVGCRRGIVIEAGGNIHIGQFNVSACDGMGHQMGTASTTSGSPNITAATGAWEVGMPIIGSGIPVNTRVTAVNGTDVTMSANATATASGVSLTTNLFQLEARGGTGGWPIHVAELRSENASAGLIYVDESSVVEVNTLLETNNGSQVGKRLFQVRNGLLRIGSCRLDAYSSVDQPFYMEGASSRSAKVVVDDLQVTGPGGSPSISQLFVSFGNNLSDLTVRAMRDHTGRASYPMIQTKLARGPVWLYGSTTTIGTFIMNMGFSSISSNLYGYAPRVPKGFSFIEITVVGDRGDGTYSRFRRLLQCNREAGNTTVVATDTIGTDNAEGTDALTSIGVDTTTHCLRLTVQGSAATTIAWQASVRLVGATTAIDL